MTHDESPCTYREDTVKLTTVLLCEIFKENTIRAKRGQEVFCTSESIKHKKMVAASP